MTLVQLRIFAIIFLGSFITSADSAVSLSVNGYTDSSGNYVCNSSAILTCKITNYFASMTWTIKGEVESRCIFDTCYNYPPFPGKYYFTSDTTHGDFNITINPLKLTDRGIQFSCSDGSTLSEVHLNITAENDDFNITYTDDSSRSALSATTGCFSSDTEVDFIWRKIQVNVTSSTTIYKRGKGVILPCASACSESGRIQRKSLLYIEEDTSGDLFMFQVEIIYLNESHRNEVYNFSRLFTLETSGGDVKCDMESNCKILFSVSVVIVWLTSLQAALNGSIQLILLNCMYYHKSKCKVNDLPVLFVALFAIGNIPGIGFFALAALTFILSDLLKTKGNKWKTGFLFIAELAVEVVVSFPECLVCNISWYYALILSLVFMSVFASSVCIQLWICTEDTQEFLEKSMQFCTQCMKNFNANVYINNDIEKAKCRKCWATCKDPTEIIDRCKCDKRGIFQCLLCGHVFCKACLADHVGGKDCGKKTHISQIINEKLACPCKRSGNKVMCMCVYCNKKMCYDCSEAHKGDITCQDGILIKAGKKCGCHSGKMAIVKCVFCKTKICIRCLSHHHDDKDCQQIIVRKVGEKCDCSIDQFTVVQCLFCGKNVCAECLKCHESCESRSPRTKNSGRKLCYCKKITAVGKCRFCKKEVCSSCLLSHHKDSSCQRLIQKNVGEMCICDAGELAWVSCLFCHRQICCICVANMHNTDTDCQRQILLKAGELCPCNKGGASAFKCLLCETKFCHECSKTHVTRKDHKVRQDRQITARGKQKDNNRLWVGAGSLPFIGIVFLYLKWRKDCRTDMSSSVQACPSESQQSYSQQYSAHCDHQKLTTTHFQLHLSRLDGYSNQ